MGHSKLDEFLQDKKQEERARKISNNVRCLVCQNQNIDDSSSAQIQFMYDSIYNADSLPDSILDIMPKGKNKSDLIGYGNAKALRKVFEGGSAEEVAKEFMDRFENPGVPHWDRRKKEALKAIKGLLSRP